MLISIFVINFPHSLVIQIRSGSVEIESQIFGIRYLSDFEIFKLFCLLNCEILHDNTFSSKQILNRVWRSRLSDTHKLIQYVAIVECTITFVDRLHVAPLHYSTKLVA